MGLMDSKRGLVVGIANEHSYAYYIAESLIHNGAECLFTHLPGEKMRRRVERAVAQLGGTAPGRGASVRRAPFLPAWA